MADGDITTSEYMLSPGLRLLARAGAEVTTIKNSAEDILYGDDVDTDDDGRPNTDGGGKHTRFAPGTPTQGRSSNSRHSSRSMPEEAIPYPAAYPGTNAQLATIDMPFPLARKPRTPSQSQTLSLTMQSAGSSSGGEQRRVV